MDRYGFYLFTKDVVAQVDGVEPRTVLTRGDCATTKSLHLKRITARLAI